VIICILQFSILRIQHIIFFGRTKPGSSGPIRPLCRAVLKNMGQFCQIVRSRKRTCPLQLPARLVGPVRPVEKNVLIISHRIIPSNSLNFRVNVFSEKSYKRRYYLQHLILFSHHNIKTCKRRNHRVSYTSDDFAST